MATHNSLPSDPSDIYGLAPPGYTVSVVRIPDLSRCNGDISDTQTRLVDQLERDAVGYYARDTSYPYAFGVRVDRAPNDGRTFLVVFTGGYPTNEGQPPSVRFDITPAMIQAAFRRPHGELICQ